MVNKAATLRQNQTIFWHGDIYAVEWVQRGIYTGDGHFTLTVSLVHFDGAGYSHKPIHALAQLTDTDDIIVLAIK